MQEHYESPFTALPCLVIHSLNGEKNTIYGNGKSIDNQHSEAVLSSVWANQNGQNPHTKLSDDKVVVAYTWQGLPFLITLDPAPSTETNKLHQFIDSYVVPLMSDYAEQLSISNQPEKLTLSLIRQIEYLRKKHIPNPEFTLSIAVTYQKNDVINVAGFGIGDTGVLLESEGEISQLISNTKIKSRHNGQTAKEKDTFGEYTNYDLDFVISRNALLVDHQVKRGDRLVSYTYLPEGMEKKTSKQPTTHIKFRDEKQTAQHSTLNTKTLLNSDNLYHSLIDTIDHIYDSQCKEAQKSPRNRHFGDDCALTTITIPDEKLQNKLKETFDKKLVNELKEILVIKKEILENLNNVKNNPNRHRFLGQPTPRYNSSSYKEDAKAILKMIDEGNTSYAVIQQSYDELIINTKENDNLITDKSNGKSNSNCTLF